MNNPAGLSMSKVWTGSIAAFLFVSTASLHASDATQPTSLNQCQTYNTATPTVFDEGVVDTSPGPSCWLRLQADHPELFPTTTTNANGETVLFLHSLKSPNGHSRLVCLTARHKPDGMELSPAVFDFGVSPPAASAMAATLHVVNHLDLPMKLHFGRVDPGDAACFSIDVDYCGQMQKITGRLLDDDSISLKPSFGCADSSGVWQAEDAPNHLQINQPIKIMKLGYGRRIDMVGSWLSKDGKLLAIRSDNAQHHDQIDLWDTDTQKRISSWDTGGNFAWPRFSDDGNSITGLDNGERIYYRFAIPTGRRMWRIDLSEVFTRPNSAHSFCMDGNRVAISSPDEGLVRIFDIKARGQLLKRIHVPQEGQQNLTVSEDGKVMAFWQFQPNTKVLFFSPETGRIISRQDVNPSVEEFGFTADDRDFIEITDDGLVFVDVASGNIHFRRGSGGTWRGAKISAAGNVIVSAFDAEALNLPAAETSVGLLLNGNSISTNSLGISGDGKRAVTLLDDGSWALWDLTAGK